MKKEIRKTLTCKHCKYQWIPRKKRPVQCPRCKRYDWEKSNGKFQGISE